ncbi:MAG: tyrosine-type recombinase/integrase [Myxococcales bacterium]|nr:tyrosine-type recombinase/integrase [Myxococcales bacterium]
MPRYIRDHIMANRLSPTTRRDYENSINLHFIPVLGDIRLDRIEARHVQALKRRKLAATTTNKMLNQLKAILRTAERWRLVEGKLPTITGVKQLDQHPKFYNFGEYRRLIAAATKLSPVTLAGVRLGGDAGLRCGEIIGLRWPNVHLDRGKLYVCDNLIRGHREDKVWIIRGPKGGRPRWVPLSAPLAKALRQLPRRGEFVLMNDAGTHLKPNGLTRRLRSAQKHAGLAPCGPHILRHSFCSHLVLRGVHVRTIQKLAGHAKLATTEVYMHLVSEVEEDAIRRLRDPEEDE